MESLKWDRALGTSKREQGVVTPRRPKSKRQRKAAERIAEKAGENAGKSEASEQAV